MTRSLLIVAFVLAFSSLAPSALAGALNSNGTCNTDSYTLADCQAACTGTWNSNTNTCTTGTGGGSTGAGNGSGGGSTGAGTGGTIVKLINPLSAGTNIQTFLNKILDFVITIGAIIVMFMLVYVGYLFVVAQGNDTKLTEAKKALLWTLIGALILLGAKAIAIGIQATVQALSAGQ